MNKLNLEQAQSIATRYMNNITLRVDENEIKKVHSAVCTCLLLDEEITPKNLANKLDSRSNIDSTLWRIVSRINEVKKEEAALKPVEPAEPVEQISLVARLANEVSELIKNTVGDELEKNTGVIETFRNEYYAALDFKDRQHDKGIAAVEKRVVTAQTRLSDLQSEFSNFRKERRSELVASKRLEKSLRNQNEQLEKKLEESESERKRINHQLQYAQNQLNAKDDEHKEAIERLAHHYQDEILLNKSIAENAQSNADMVDMLESEVALLTQKNELLKTQVKRLQLNSNNIAESIETAVEKRTNEKTAKITELEASIESLTNTTSELTREIEYRDAAQTTLDDVIRQLDAKTMKESELLGVIRQLENDMDLSTDAFSKEREEIENHHTLAISDFEATIEKLKQQLNEAKAKTKNAVKAMPLPNGFMSTNGQGDASLIAEQMELRSELQTVKRELQETTKKLMLARNRQIKIA